MTRAVGIACAVLFVALIAWTVASSFGGILAGLTAGGAW